MYFISYYYRHIPAAADLYEAYAPDVYDENVAYGRSAAPLIDILYAERPPKEDFLAWRDERALDEAHWYG